MVAENNLETSPTTITSAIPVTIATGIILKTDFLVFLERLSKRRINRFKVLLFINI